MKRILASILVALSLSTLSMAQWKPEMFPEYGYAKKVTVTTYSFTALFTADYAGYEAYLISPMPVLMTTYTYTLAQNVKLDAYINNGSSVTDRFPLCTGPLQDGNPPLHIYTNQTYYLVSTATTNSEVYMLRQRRR